MGRTQRGYGYEASGAFYLRYKVDQIVDGGRKRVQKSYELPRTKALCEKMPVL
jgi:hypothetical protein